MVIAAVKDYVVCHAFVRMVYKTCSKYFILGLDMDGDC